MAWYPGATHWPLNCETTDRSHTPVRMTLHTAVSGATNLYKYGPYRGTYSTFYVNGGGDVYQYASTGQATRASGAGNFGDISVETWDGASERALTASQVTAPRPAARLDMGHPPQRAAPDRHPRRTSPASPGTAWAAPGISADSTRPIGRPGAGRRRAPAGPPPTGRTAPTTRKSTSWTPSTTPRSAAPPNQTPSTHL